MIATRTHVRVDPQIILHMKLTLLVQERVKIIDSDVLIIQIGQFFDLQQLCPDIDLVGFWVGQEFLLR